MAKEFLSAVLCSAGYHRQYLIPKQLEANGLEERHLVVTPSAIQRIINGYTREAGVRQVGRSKYIWVGRIVVISMLMGPSP